MHIITYVAKITEETAPLIIEDAAKFHLNVDPMDDQEHADFYGATALAILSVNHQTKQATFTTMWDEDFDDVWQRTGATHGDIWHVITLKN